MTPKNGFEFKLRMSYFENPTIPVLRNTFQTFVLTHFECTNNQTAITKFNIYYQSLELDE